MTIPIPIGVRLKTSRGTKHVTRELRSLSFRTTAPGGYASAAFSLDRPLTIDPDEINYYGNVYFDDLRNGMIVWEGRLEDPGRSAGADGQVWDLAAVGPAAHVQDKVVPRIYVDSSNERWLLGALSDRGGRVESTERSSDHETPAMALIFQEGMSLTSLSNVDMRYRAISDCGQQLGRVRADFSNAITNNLVLRNRMVTRIGPGAAADTFTDKDWTSGTDTIVMARASGTVPIGAGDDVVDIRIERYSGTETATASRWGEFWNIAVRAILKDINGNDLTGSGGTSYYLVNYVTAAEVITDLIGRGDLYKFDAATASIDTSGAAQIDQLAFPTGVSPAEILDALMEFEPAFYWATWKSQANGKYRFEWKPWPTTIRYEADIKEGYTAPGSADGLFNEALIAYRDWRGRERTALSTSTVADLTNAGLTRTYHDDLTDESNSLANAQRVGAQALTDHAAAPNAGALTIARPVRDFLTGRYVQPWEILPGFLIRVRGIRPNLDSLNATARDGVTVFKIASNTYATDSATATLELDSFTPSIARALAQLSKKRGKRKRR